MGPSWFGSGNQLDQHHLDRLKGHLSAPGRTLTVLRVAMTFCVLALLLLSVRAEAVTVPGQFPTIQAAVNAVVSGALPDGTVIDVAAGHYPEAVNIAHTPRSMTIRGAGPGSTALVGNGTGFSGFNMNSATGTIRIESLAVVGVGSAFPGIGGGFSVAGSSPTFANVHFLGNSAAMDGGGGVLANSNAVFENCLFDSNAAPRFGGGILVGGSRPTFRNTIIQNNVSGYAVAHGSGGGVHANNSALTFLSSTIRKNRSVFAGGGIGIIGSYGSPFGTSTVLLQDSEVSENATNRFNAGDPDAVGGGLATEDNVVVTIVRSSFRGNFANSGAGIFALRSRVDISGSIIEGNVASDPGGPGGNGAGINVLSAAPGVILTLTDSVVRDNQATRWGGGVLATGIAGTCNGGSPLGCVTTMTISGSLIAENTANGFGGGVYAATSILTMSSSQVLRNEVNNQEISPAGQVGGGVAVVGGTTANISSTSIAGNRARVLGGGFYVDQGSVVNISGSVIYKNSTVDAKGGGAFYVAGTGASFGTISNNDLADNGNFTIREDFCPITGPTMLAYKNNRITPAAGNDFYTSPNCGLGDVTSINAFNNLSPGETSGNTAPSSPGFAPVFTATPDTGTNVLPTVLAWTMRRVNGVTISPNVGSQSGDTGMVDVAPVCPTTYTVTGSPSGGGSATAIAQGNAVLSQLGPGFLAYPAGFSGGLSVAFGTVSTTPVVITGAGPGAVSHVRVVGVDGSPKADFLAYDPSFTGGVYVAFAPNIGGSPAIITGPGEGGGPHVKIFRINPSNFAVTQLGGGVMAYDPLFTGGVSVGFAPNIGGAPAILTAPGPGGGPHVRVFNVSASGTITGRGGGVMAYDPLFAGGVTFAVGDVTGDGTPEVITAPGPGGGPHVKLFNVDGAGNFSEPFGGGFFAFEATFAGGVSIAVGNVDAQGSNELITAHLGGSPLVRIFSIAPGGAATAFSESLVYDGGFVGGVRVAAGNVDGDAKAEIVTAPGPGGGPHVKLFKFPCP